MKNDTRTAIMKSLSAMDSAKEALVRSLDQVDRHNIRNGLNQAMEELKDASAALDHYIDRPGTPTEKLRLARYDIDKAILTLEPHQKWFATFGDSEERR